MSMIAEQFEFLNLHSKVHYLRFRPVIPFSGNLI